MSPNHSIPGNSSVFDNVILGPYRACLRFPNAHVLTIVNKNIAN